MPLIALVLAWLVPGAGHAYTGRVTRGIVIFAVIGATFWSGVAVGGVMTVDYYNERWWFVAQMCAGVHGLVSWHRQNRIYQEVAQEISDEQQGKLEADLKNDRGEERKEERRRELRKELRQLLEPPRNGAVSKGQMLIDRKLTEKGIGLVAPPDTVARAYAGVAGLLNLMCIFDAVLLSIMGLVGEAGIGEPSRKTGEPE
jgi:hypothetical protein